jgi:hypothetical protein
MIINSTTNLNKLKFTSSGGDRWDEGKSGQPYIVEPIPGANDTFQEQLDGQPQSKGGVDFLLRGGLSSVEASIRDVSRLTKLLFDTKSPNGFEFIAKQNVLSRNNVKTEGSFGVGYAGGGLNQGLYLPVGTLAQTAVAPIATGATNLFGLNPFTDNSALAINDNEDLRTGSGGINGYFGVVNAQNNISNDATTNRLYKILDGVITGTQQETVGGKITLNPGGSNRNILEYGGGPKSVLGVGKTRIPFADQRTGQQNPSLTSGEKSFFNNPTFQNKPLDNPNYIPSFGDYSIFSRPNVNIPDSNVFLGVTGLQGIAQVGDNNIFNTFLDNENDANNLTNAEFDNPNKFKPNLADKVVLDNSIDKASNFKRVDGPDNYNALNSSSPTTTEGIYGGENTINSGIIKGNIFAVGASRQFNELFPNQNLSTLSEDSLAVKISSLKYDDQPDGGITNNFSVYNSGSLINNEQVLNRYNAAVMTQAQLNARGLTSKGNSTALYNPSDFRKTTNRGEFTDNASMLADLGTSTVLSLAPDYVRANQITKFNYGDPGQHKTSESEEINNVINYGVNANLLDALDKINALPIYAGSTVDNSLAVKDSCDFNIGIINNNNSGATNDYLHFRALIDNFSDNYTAKWDAVQYVGRGEELYNYKGFGREISMGWTVYAQSKAELIPMYKKLNYLASSLAPDYTGAGFMRGNIVKITVGGYIYDQPGIIKSISYGIPEESPWEIAIGVDGEEDTSVKQLPHMIKVTGFTFIPIHKFIPAKANSTTDPTQKYIALANQTGKTNYSDTYKNYSQQGAVRE